MTKKTKKQDAESIVGEEEVGKIEKALATSKVAKADVLIEMSDTEPTEEETAELVAEAEGSATEEDSTLETEPETENIEPAADPIAEPIIEPVVKPEPVFQNAHTEPVAQMSQVVTATETIQVHPLQPAIDELLASVDNSVRMKSDAERAELVNPALQKFALAIQDYVVKSNVSPAPDENEMLRNIKELIQPLAESVKALADDVGVLKAQYGAQGVKVENRIPQPRTIPAQVFRSVAERPANKPFSTDEIARKSVGIS